MTNARPVDGTGHRFIRNIAAGWASRITSMGLTFLVTPLLVHGLGREQYGLWAVALAFAAYLALIDIGVTGGLVREISIARAAGDSARIGQLVATGTAFYAVVGAVLVAAIVVLHDRLAAALGVPHHLVADTGLLLITVTAVLSLENLTAAFNQVFTALEKMHITGVMTLLASASNAVAYIVALVVLHGGIRAVALASVPAALLVTVTSGLSARRVCPAVSISPRRISSSAFRTIVRLSVAIQLSNIAGVVNLQVDKLVIAGFVGLASAGAYDIASRLTFIIWMLTWMIAGAAYPVVSRLSSGSWDAARPFFARADRYMQIATFGLSGGLMAVAPWLVPLWLGPGFPRVIVATEVLSVSAAAISFTQVVRVTLWGLNRVREMFVFEAWRLGMHLALSLVLTWRLGFNGALVGVLGGTITPSIWLTWVGHRRLGVSSREWLAGALAGPLIGAIGAVGTSLLVTRLVLVHLLGQTSPLALAILLLVGGLVFVVTYAASLLRFKTLCADDLALLRESRLLYWGRVRGLTGASS